MILCCHVVSQSRSLSEVTGKLGKGDEEQMNWGWDYQRRKGESALQNSYATYPALHLHTPYITLTCLQVGQGTTDTAHRAS